MEKEDNINGHNQEKRDPGVHYTYAENSSPSNIVPFPLLRKVNKGKIYSLYKALFENK